MNTLNQSILRGKIFVNPATNYTLVMLLMAMLSLLTLITEGCKTKASDTPEEVRTDNKTEILDGGNRIRLSGATDKIAVTSAQRSQISSEIKVPCKIVLASAPGSKNERPVLLYENNDLTDAFSDYLKTKTQIDKLKREVDRLNALFEHRAASGKELQDAQTELAQAKTTLADIQSRLLVLGIQPEKALEMQSGQVLVIADVPEAQLGKVHTGSNVTIVFNSYPEKKFVSKVLSVSGVVDPVTRSVKVQILLPNAESRLLPGLYGQTILGVAEESAVTVPVTSLFTARGKSYVFVQTTADTYELRNVLAGTQGSDMVEILNGIAENEKVVNKGTMLLKALSFGY